MSSCSALKGGYYYSTKNKISTKNKSKKRRTRSKSYGGYNSSSSLSSYKPKYRNKTRRRLSHK